MTDESKPNASSEALQRVPVMATRVLTFDLHGDRAQGDDGIPVVVSSDAIVDVDVKGLTVQEILVHTAEAIDLSRAPLPIIATHRENQINVGIVDDLKIGGGQLRGIARFGSRPEALGYRDDVKNRIIRSLSVGYAREKSQVRKDGVVVTSRWTPLHAAMVAEPADINAGFYRALPPLQVDLIPDEPSAESAPEAVATRSITPAKPAVPTGDTIVSDEKTAAAGVSADEQKSTTPPVEFEKRRKEAITKLCRANRLDERHEAHWIESGATLDEVADGLVEILAERGRVNPQSVAKLDLSKGDQRRYSLMRALRAASNKDWRAAGLELECNKELVKRLNQIPRAETSFFVPLDVLMRDLPNQGRRDMTVAGVSGSNYLVSTDNQPGSFIDLLRNTSVALRLGVTRLSGLVGNVTIPKMTAGNTAYWLADEATQVTESQPTIGQLSLSPKNVAALTELSHQLMQQSSPDAENLVLSSIARDIGLAVDVGIIRGSGASGQPTGIVTTGSIGAFTGTSLAAPGVLNSVSDVAAANALNDGCAFVTTPAVAALLMDRPNVTSATDGTPLWQGRMEEGTIRGYRAVASQQMAAATALFGWWPSVILAEWGVLELMVNPFSDFTRGLSAIRGWYSCDVGVRYAGAWSYASSIT